MRILVDHKSKQAEAGEFGDLWIIPDVEIMDAHDPKFVIMLFKKYHIHAILIDFMGGGGNARCMVIGKKADVQRWWDSYDGYAGAGSMETVEVKFEPFSRARGL